MSRPIVLIKKELLKELYRKHKYGVKYLTLIRDHNLNTSSSTLKRLLNYYEMMLNSDDITKHKIELTLFPCWLQEDLQKQDTKNWVYKGTLPLGKWSKVNVTEEK